MRTDKSSQADLLSEAEETEEAGEPAPGGQAAPAEAPHLFGFDPLPHVVGKESGHRSHAALRRDEHSGHTVSQGMEASGTHGGTGDRVGEPPDGPADQPVGDHRQDQDHDDP